MHVAGKLSQTQGRSDVPGILREDRKVTETGYTGIITIKTCIEEDANNTITKTNKETNNKEMKTNNKTDTLNIINTFITPITFNTFNNRIKKDK